MAKKDTSTKSPKKPGMTKKPDGTIELTIVIPWNEVKKVKSEVEKDLSKKIKVPGFRNGKAPKKITDTKLSAETIKEELLKRVLGVSYGKAVADNNIHPIVTPRVHVEVFKDEADIVFTADTCEEPEIKLNNYKDGIKKITAKSKIIIPGKESKKPTLDDIFNAGMKSISITIPKILIDNEVSRVLSQLLEEIKKLGLTLDQYLESRKQTVEELQTNYRTKAEKDLQLEFFLKKVADEEKIIVEQKDIDEAIKKIEDEKQRDEMSKNPYVVASIIRQQKTIDFLSKL